ncbi:YggS family pyridoxal phosphate-dependent enzyme [Agrobacterium sp. ICMP 6402]|uniref:YggS family pyridoxal phosphate-dependent enzyme n=1 Tax=Agrobacterium sp. ICMP 6402 TaxID=2292443 RepID=UPI0012964CB7|nr:YggS family pyridoxal phosphate-dependent enzyme [Agrobacterium sp. ICMP 6402]MQB12475.1 YggS family pyridoxal phosphate-dependent enzyme [Agrobacterium sp. ICMP 6402]
MSNTSEPTGTLAANLSSVTVRIASAAARAGRPTDAVRFVLVTKTIEAERVREVIRLGAGDLGENKVQEGRSKAEALSGEPAQWSMIGHLQSNKVKDVLRFASEVQSLDRLSLATALEKRLQFLGRGLDVLVQVNTSGEASKFGLAPDAVAPFLKELTAFDAIRLRGFMTLATFTPEETEVRRCFRLLRNIRDRARSDAPQGAALSDLSMGMSGDFEWAIEEGATIVRVGQAVFGARALPASYYWPGAAGAT